MEHPLGKKRITEKGRPKAHALHRTNVNNFAAYYVKYSLKLGNLKFGKNEGRITAKLLFQPNRMFSKFIHKTYHSNLALCFDHKYNLQSKTLFSN